MHDMSLLQSDRHLSTMRIFKFVSNFEFYFNEMNSKDIFQMFFIRLIAREHGNKY